jgi:YjbE family integral membrane protein
MGYSHIFGVLGATVEIALIDLLLSGDNALVIALVCRRLSPLVRRQAVWLGTVAGVALRIGLTALAALILSLPLLKVVGAVLLVVIAIRLVIEPHARVEADAGGRRNDLWTAVATILVADTVMSIDNILAVAAAAHGSYLLLSLGLLLSVPILVFGSQMLSGVLDRYPLLIAAGSALLGWVAGDMAIADPLVKGWIAAQPFAQSFHLAAAAPFIGAACVLCVGPLLRFRRRPVR